MKNNQVAGVSCMVPDCEGHGGRTLWLEIEGVGALCARHNTGMIWCNGCRLSVFDAHDGTWTTKLYADEWMTRLEAIHDGAPVRDEGVLCDWCGDAVGLVESAYVVTIGSILQGKE